MSGPLPEQTNAIGLDSGCGTRLRNQQKFSKSGIYCSHNASPHFSQLTRGWAKSVAEVADESVCKASQENRDRCRHVEGIVPPPAYVRRGLETSRKRTPARRPRSSYLRNDAALIKYVAAYRVAQVQAITHIAPVKSIEPWKDSGKSVINFTEPAKEISPIPMNKIGRG